MEKIITVQYFTLDDFGTPVASTFVELSADNKLSVSALEKEFNLRTVKKIVDGVPVLIGFDEHGRSDNPFVPNSRVKITGEPKGIIQLFSLFSNSFSPFAKNFR